MRRFRYLRYLPCRTRRPTTTTTVLSILSETTTPSRCLRRPVFISAPSAPRSAAGGPSSRAPDPASPGGPSWGSRAARWRAAGAGGRARHRDPAPWSRAPRRPVRAPPGPSRGHLVALARLGGERQLGGREAQGLARRVALHTFHLEQHAP